jgi:formate dehydrogenase alpha subunit
MFSSTLDLSVASLKRKEHSCAPFKEVTMEYRFVPTTCPYCGCGCQMLLEVLDGKLIGTHPIKTAGMNEGKLCIKGWKVHEFVHSEERLTVPLIKSNGAFREASWDEALTLVAEKLSTIRDQHGPDALGFLSSARCTNEENYLVQKIARMAIGTNNVDHCARL